jgi:hypothetical protein
MSCPVYDSDPGSKTLWQVELMFNSTKTESECFVWSDSPDVANTHAVSAWGRYNPQHMLRNIDGKSTKPGEKHASYAVMQNGSSLAVNVDTTFPYGLATNILKRCLKSRGQDSLTPGKKGKQAKHQLASRLAGYIETPPMSGGSSEAAEGFKGEGGLDVSQRWSTEDQAAYEAHTEVGASVEELFAAIVSAGGSVSTTTTDSKSNSQAATSILKKPPVKRQLVEVSGEEALGGCAASKKLKAAETLAY